MKSLLRLLALIAAALPGCGGGANPAYYGEGANQDYNDPGQSPLKDEIRSLPFKHLEWEHKLTDKQIARMTLAGDHLFIETPDHQVVAMDRYSGEVKWIYKVGTETVLDWPPVVAAGVPEEIRRLEAEITALNRQIKDFEKEGKVGPDTTGKLQKTRNEKRELLKVAQFGDNVYFLSHQILYCLDRVTGNERWTRRLTFVPGSQPFAIRNFVFIAGSDLNRVWAVDVEKKGLEVNYYNTDLGYTENQITARPIYDDPALYFVSHDGKIYCYTVKDGRLAWTFPTDRPMLRPLKADPIIHHFKTKEFDRDEKGNIKVDEKGKPTGVKERDQKILFIGGMDYAFYAIDAAGGGISWKYEAAGLFKTPAVAKDMTVYAKSEEGALFAWNVAPTHPDGGPKRNGELRWKLPLGERFLVKGKSYVYVLAPKNEIYSMNEMTGEIIGRYKLDKLQASLAMTNTADDFFYCANGAGYIFCLRESKENY